jgi:hypothetical protein
MSVGCMTNGRNAAWEGTLWVSQKRGAARPSRPSRCGTAVVTFLPFRDSFSVDARQTTFHGVYSRYSADVYRFAYWLTGNADDAQDITAETFVRAWTAPEEPRMETVKAYLFTIARNLHRKQWRRQSRLEVLDESMPGRRPNPTKPPSTGMNSGERWKRSAGCPKWTGQCFCFGRSRNCLTRILRP